MMQERSFKPAHPFWSVVWMLLRLRILILVSSFRRAKLRNRIIMILFALLILFFLGMIFYLSWAMLNFLRAPELAALIGDTLLILENLPILIVSATFIGVMLTSFGVLLQALYLAGDMEFLLSAPIPMRAVFLAKLLQAILPNFGLICLFSLPLLFGMAASSGYSWVFYPMLLVILCALALAAAGISSLLVMVSARLFPARRLAELLGFLGAILSFLCSQSGQLANWSQFSPDQTQQALSMVKRFNTPWSPLAWAGRGIIHIGKGEFVQGFGLIVPVALLCSVIFWIALSASERLYFSGWANLQINQKKRKTSKAIDRARNPSRLIAALQRWRLSALWGIILKDLMVLRRDLRNMSQLVTPLIIGVVYFVMLLRGGNTGPDFPEQTPVLVTEMLKNVRIYANVGLALFVGWMLLGRLAGMGFAHEGRSYWLLKSAPVGPGQLIAAKYLVAYLPTWAICTAFLLVTMLIEMQTPSILLFSLPVVSLSIAGNAGINLAFGVTGANMNWEDPRQMQRTASGCLGSFASMLYLPMGLVLFFGPPIVAQAFDLPMIVGQLTGLLLGGAFSLICAILPLWLVRKKVEQLGEA